MWDQMSYIPTYKEIGKGLTVGLDGPVPDRSRSKSPVYIYVVHTTITCLIADGMNIKHASIPIPQRIGLACEKWHGHVNPGEPGFLRGYPLLPFALRRLRLLASVCSVASSLAFRESFGSTLCPPPLISIHEPWKSASDGRHLNPRCTSFRYISYHMKYQ